MRQFGVTVVEFLRTAYLDLLPCRFHLCLRAQITCIILEDSRGVRYSPLFYAVHDKLAGCGHQNNVEHAFLPYPTARMTHL
jgi:hypothetical protein